MSKSEAIATERFAATSIDRLTYRRRSLRMNLLLQGYINAPTERKETLCKSLEDKFGVTPEFIIAFDQIEALPKTLSGSVDAFVLFRKCVALAPDALKTEVIEKFEETFGGPPKTWYDENGEGYYTLEETAKILDVSVEDLERQVGDRKRIQ